MMKKFEKVEQKDLNKVVGGVSEVASAQTASSMSDRAQSSSIMSAKSKAVSTRAAKTQTNAPSVRYSGMPLVIGKLVSAVALHFFDRNK